MAEPAAQTKPDNGTNARRMEVARANRTTLTPEELFAKLMKQRAAALLQQRAANARLEQLEVRMLKIAANHPEAAQKLGIPTG